MNRLLVGDAVQVNEKVPEWAGCLMIVDEIRAWGIQASMKIPNRGTAYLRLKSDQYEYVGRAVLIPVGDENDE